MKKILFLTIFSLATSAVLADVGDTFFSIKLGSSNSNDAGISTSTDQTNNGGHLGETNDNDLGNSGIFGVSVGKYFSESFRSEIGISQRKGYKYDAKIRLMDGIPYTDSNIEKADVKSLTVFLSGYFESQPMILLQKSVTPYLGFGVGISRNKMETVDLFQDGALLGTLAGNTETEFSRKFALGTLIELSDNVSIDLNYQYVDLGDIKSGSDLSFDARDMAAPITGPEITSNEFNVGLQIAF